MLRILICWHFENEQPVTCGYNTALTNILIMQIEKHGWFNYHRSNHWSSLITLDLFIHNHISIPLTSQLCRTVSQTPADITNPNSIPASLEESCNRTPRRWGDKWAFMEQEKITRSSKNEHIFKIYSIHSDLYYRKNKS